MKAGARSSTAMAAIAQTHGCRGMNRLSLSPESIVGFIGDIFNRRGAESYPGEDVTMSQHILQGAFLAEQASASDELIAVAQRVVERFAAIQMNE